MTKKTSFLKHAAVYGAGNLLVSAGSFLLVPLYVRFLAPADYGTLDVFNRLADVVLVCLLYGGFRQALIAFHNQAEGEAERRAVVGSTLLVTVLLLGTGGALVMVFARSLCVLLQSDAPHLLRLAVASVFLESLYLMLLALAQARVESVFFAAVSFAQFLLRAILCILLVAGLGQGIAGVLVASCVASGLLAVLLLAREVARGGLRVDPRQLRAMALFAIPFIPGGICGLLLNTGDRFFLLKYAGPAVVGGYALGYKLACAVKLFSRRPLYMVWSARMYEAARQPDAPVVFGKIATRILAAYVGVGLGLCLVQDEVVTFLAGNGYSGAASVIAPVVLGYFFLTAADMMDAGFYIRRRTALKTLVTLTTTAVMLLLYWLLIPPFGMQGAALATLLGFGVHVALTTVVAQRVFPVHYEWARVAALLGWAVVLWLFSRMLPSGWSMLPARAALWFVWPLALWHGGIVSVEEKAWARALARTIANRMGLGHVRGGPLVPVMQPRDRAA